MHNNVGRWNKNEVSMDKMPRCSVIYKSIKRPFNKAFFWGKAAFPKFSQVCCCSFSFYIDQNRKENGTVPWENKSEDDEWCHVESV